MSTETERIVAWVTKYALTEGIIEVYARVCGDTMIAYTYNGIKYAHGNDWHKTKKEALVRAEDMRLAKIVSLKKAMAKIEALKF